jgi:arsenite methyltransferase
VAQRRAVVEAIQLKAGERVLDVGSGPGFLVAEIAEAVGSTGSVFGIDISESMMRMAERRCAGLPRVTLEVGDAQSLKYADGAFDVVVSTQVLEYVADSRRVLDQVFRVVRPDGRIAVLATDWASLVWHGPDDKLMERVLSAWATHCADPHLPRTLGPRLRDAGFEITHRNIIPLYLHSADHIHGHDED